MSDIEVRASSRTPNPEKEASMRKLAAITGLAVLVLTAAPALADGPSGSREEDGSKWDNQMRCGKATVTPAAVIFVSQKGAEVCNDGRAVLPVQGRVIVTTQQGGYVAADGDRSNPTQAEGWARVGRDGVRCGDTRGRLDATHPTAKDTSADCG